MLLVELGVHTGHSYNAFCQAVKTLKTATHCYGIDTWKGDQHAGWYGEDIYQNLLQYQLKEYAEFSNLLRMTFDEGLAYFSYNSIDLLHIDGLHTYEAVKHDFESWLPKMSDKGVILLHDTFVRERGFGVWRLWEEIASRYPSFNFTHGHGLGIAAVGPNVAKDFLDFLHGASEDSFYRKLFFNLGRQLTLEESVREKEGRIAALNASVREKEGRIAALNASVEEKDTRIASLEESVGEKDGLIAALNASVREKEALIQNIYSSHGWRLLTKYYRLIDWLLPVGSRRRRAGKYIRNAFRKEKASAIQPTEGRMGSLEGSVSEKEAVFSYIKQSGGIVALRHVALCVSSIGNLFMREIANILKGGFRELGAQVDIYDETISIRHSDFDWVLVIAPHEFFVLGDGYQRFSELNASPNLLMLNTEQAQTQWFATGERFLRAARAVFDINFQTAIQLKHMGLTAFFLPLGYDATFEARYTEESLPEHELLKHLAPSVRKSLAINYGERPIDILFVGTISPRREQFFARHAGYFASRNTFIYLPDGNVPFLPNDVRSLDFKHLIGLIRRSKIVLNIHRDDHFYLEWQRIVTLGILQKTVVLSEHCQHSPVIEANVDYVDVPLDELPAVCELYLADPERARILAESAYERLRREFPMNRILRQLLSNLSGGE
jgi:uncharacterized coiled-coil protein SlyX